MKKCPYCAEEIQDEAIVCKHCGRDLAPAIPIKKKKRKSATVTIAGLIFLVLFLCLLIGITGGDKGEKSSPGQINAQADDTESIQTAAFETALAELQVGQPTNTPLTVNTSLPSVTPEPFEHLEGLVAEVLGSSNRDVLRLSEFSWNADRSEITVTFAAQDNLTENMIKRGIQIDIVDILRTIQTSNTPILYKSIVTVATFPLVDAYGNSKESNVVIATYTRENLDKVNWDNFLTDNVYVIANQDNLFIHPAAHP